VGGKKESEYNREREKKKKMGLVGQISEGPVGGSCSKYFRGVLKKSRIAE